MYGFQLEEAQVGLVMKLKCLGVPMFVVNVGEGDPIRVSAHHPRLVKTAFSDLSMSAVMAVLAFWWSSQFFR